MTAEPLASPAQLKWSAQLTATAGLRTTNLQGDKIILPQSALEQLLSAATVTVTRTASSSLTDGFDPFNPYSFAAERQARSQVVERQQQLPHPLTFRLVDPESGNAVYAGIREFSAADDKIELSPFLRQALGHRGNKASEAGKSETPEQGETLPSNSDGFTRITVHAQQLPKGTYVRLRPLEAGYDPEDWKSLLERYLRDNFTTLTNGEILTVPAGKDEFRFLIDGITPEGEGICIVDTDLEVDIEALNEDQARESLKRRLERSQKAPGTQDGSSSGGPIRVGTDEFGQVRLGEYVDYRLESWDHSKDLEIEIVGPDTEKDVDIFVNPYGPRQRSRPREKEHVFSDLSSRPTKKIKIQHTNVELESAEALWISVCGYLDADEDSGNLPETRPPLSYQVRVSTVDQVAGSAQGDIQMEETEPSSSDEARCKNCHQWVPKRTMMLHENFCLRNNILCPICDRVFQKSSTEWKSHWHCQHDDGSGDSSISHVKHDHIFHTAQTCSGCFFLAPNIPSLARHRTTDCPAKLILCQFCHLIVPQQGPDDLDPYDAEVLLSGLTPHELSDGARTTNCHICSRIIRLRDMSAHLKHHDLERLSRPIPRICRNVNCGRTMDGVTHGDIKRPQSQSRNELDICDVCFGPLYVNTYDPEGKALRRRVERKYLTQLLTGCGKDWCRNEYCKTSRKYLDSSSTGQQSIPSKEALAMVKPYLDDLKGGKGPLHFCTDEMGQKRRILADMMAAESVADGEGTDGKGKTDGYEVEWCVAALEAESGDLQKARTWLADRAPTRAEAAKRKA